jgi:hypothetical protein
MAGFKMSHATLDRKELLESILRYRNDRLENGGLIHNHSHQEKTVLYNPEQQLYALRRQGAMSDFSWARQWKRKIKAPLPHGLFGYTVLGEDWMVTNWDNSYWQEKKTDEHEDRHQSSEYVTRVLTNLRDDIPERHHYLKPPPHYLN